MRKKANATKGRLAAHETVLADRDELVRGLSGADVVGTTVRDYGNERTDPHEPGKGLRTEVVEEPRDDVVPPGVSKRFGKPYVWVTWLTRLLAGENVCEYALWYRAHYKYPKTADANFDSAGWTADHTALVQRRARELGGILTLEDQNDFKLVGESAVLAGKMDIVAKELGTALVSDAKTGKKHDADFWQVLLYLFAIKFMRVKERRWDLGRVRGEVVYRDGVVLDVNAEDLTPDREASIVRLLKVAGAEHAPEARPSLKECRFCDISTCVYRRSGDATTAQAHTSAF